MSDERRQEKDLDRVTVRQMRISGEVLMLLGSGQYEVIADELPKDARLVSMALNANRDQVILYIASAEFGDEDFDIPLRPPIIKQMEKPYNHVPKDLKYEVN
jgi:hypothetical protein